MAINYFDFFGIPIRFVLDEAALKRQFYVNSKKYHPDFYTLESAEKQAEILELSTLNNEAYKSLSDFDRRMKYILELKGVFAEEGKNKIPQAFLVEMMDINESLMELEFDFDPNSYQKLLETLKNQETNLYQNISPILENYQDQEEQATDLEKIKKYYLKKRYLLRIKENLDKFASL